MQIQVNNYVYVWSRIIQSFNLEQEVIIVFFSFRFYIRTCFRIHAYSSLAVECGIATVYIIMSKILYLCIKRTTKIHYFASDCISQECGLFAKRLFPLVQSLIPILTNIANVLISNSIKFWYPGHFLNWRK